MIVIKIQGKGTACKPNQYIENNINYKNIYLFSLK